MPSSIGFLSVFATEYKSQIFQSSQLQACLNQAKDCEN